MIGGLSVEDVRAVNHTYVYTGYEEISPYLHVLCDEIVHYASVVRVLEGLGYEQYADEIKLKLKYWVSELVIKLATQKYVNGLASELSSTVKPLWSLRISDEELRFYLYKLLNFGISVRDGKASSEAAKDLLLDFIDIFEVDLIKVPTVMKVLEDLDPELVLQTLLVGLIASTKGLSGGHNIVEN